MAENEKLQKSKKHLFTVEILLENESNGKALEILLRILNNPDILDYQIKSGIELGKTIQSAYAEHLKLQIASAKEKLASAPKAAAPAPTQDHPLIQMIEHYRQNNTLVRLAALKGKGVKLSMPCRIIALDPQMQVVTVYHDDEKKVYQFKLGEIEDITVQKP